MPALVVQNLEQRFVYRSFLFVRGIADIISVHGPMGPERANKGDRMGLFDMFKKKSEEPKAPAGPAFVDAQSGEDVLCAPATGSVISMAEVPDPVFSGEILGRGCAVWPEDDVVYAPIDGAVTVTMGHAMGIKSASGIEALVHVGVDTVNLQGKGFEAFAKQGDQVKAGQPILKMDRAVIAEAGYKDCVILAVSNTPEFASVDMSVQSGEHVDAGAVVVTVVRK